MRVGACVWVSMCECMCVWGARVRVHEVWVYVCGCVCVSGCICVGACVWVGVCMWMHAWVCVCV